MPPRQPALLRTANAMTSSDDGRAMTRSGGIAAPDVRKPVLLHRAARRRRPLRQRARGRRGDARVSGRKPTSPPSPPPRTGRRSGGSTQRRALRARAGCGRRCAPSTDRRRPGRAVGAAAPRRRRRLRAACAKHTPFLLPWSEDQLSPARRGAGRGRGCGRRLRLRQRCASGQRRGRAADRVGRLGARRPRTPRRGFGLVDPKVGGARVRRGHRRRRPRRLSRRVVAAAVVAVVAKGAREAADRTDRLARGISRSRAPLFERSPPRRIAAPSVLRAEPLPLALWRTSD